MPVRLERIPVAEVFAANQVNAVVFRAGPLVSHAGRQYVAFYDPDGEIVLGARRRDATGWSFAPLGYRGAMRDAHNAISLGVGPDGRLHIAYDHHGHRLRYRLGTAPGGLGFGPEVPMTGVREERVTYPQFIHGPGGRLHFLYRDGGSGNGDLCLNTWDPEAQRWLPLHRPLVAGEGLANPYWWRPSFDRAGALHLAWCWRRTPDAATNRDVCYAVSRDGGRSWGRSDGSPYRLPITAAQAEVADPVAEGGNLVNQCSSAADGWGRPHLVHYRNDAEGIPQIYHVHWDGAHWRAHPVTRRRGRFSLAGGGTLRPPLSRPDIVVDDAGTACVIYRDDEAGGRVRVALGRHPAYADWEIQDVWDDSVGAWEPSHDETAWRDERSLELWVHRCEQGEHERNSALAAQPASVLRLHFSA